MGLQLDSLVLPSFLLYDIFLVSPQITRPEGCTSMWTFYRLFRIGLGWLCVKEISFF